MTDNKTQKHILVISQYFYPEQFRINDICCEWVKRGYKITVLTGIPNYPQGTFYEGYGWNKRRTETWNGIDIIRIPLIARGHSSIGLILNYFSFPISGWFWKMKTKIKPDYIFMFETSPMTQCKIGVWFKKKVQVPLYLYAQDLWPDNVEVITGIHSKLIINPIQRMVDKIYNACDQIFVTSQSFVESVCARGISRDKVHYWPQYAEEFYEPMERKSVPEIPEDGRLKIVFTGNIGYAQGLDILPKTAKILKKDGYGDKICFVIIGDGRYKVQLEKEIEDVKDMFVMVPRQPAERIPELLAACDVAFLSFANNDLWKKTIPAKLQSYMACGMPVLASAEGETKTIIDDAKCGIASPLGDVEALTENIIKYSHDYSFKIAGSNGRKYYLDYFAKDYLFDRIEDFFR